MAITIREKTIEIVVEVRNKPQSQKKGRKINEMNCTALSRELEFLFEIIIKRNFLTVFLIRNNRFDF